MPIKRGWSWQSSCRNIAGMAVAHHHGEICRSLLMQTRWSLFGMENREEPSLSLRCAKEREKRWQSIQYNKGSKKMEYLEAERYLPAIGSKSTSLYCGSIFDSPSKRKNPANLTACGVFWSWQCDSNTRPADYKPNSIPFNMVERASSGFFTTFETSVGTAFLWCFYLFAFSCESKISIF